MVLWRLKQYPLTLPAGLINVYQNYPIQSAIHYLSMLKTQKEITAALNQAAIPALWLKGIALAHTVYPQPSLRPMSDLDVLVPYDQRQAALRVAEQLGYRIYQPQGGLLSADDQVRFKMTYHFALRGGIADSVLLELHFHLLSADDSLLSQDRLAWFWSQTNVIHNGSSMTVLKPEAHLLYLAAHALLQHGEAESTLRQFLDMHLLIANSTLDWPLVTAQARAFGWQTALLRALTLSSDYFNTPVPDDALAALRLPVNDAGAARALPVAEPGTRLEKLWPALRATPAPDRLRMLRQVLFPSRTYMRHRYRVRPGFPVGLFYLVRWWHQGREVARTLWRRVGRVIRR